MAREAKRGAIIETIRQRLPDIKAWQTEGVSQREMSRRLEVSESSFRSALAQVGGAAAGEPTEVHSDIPAQLLASPTKVYEGVPLPQPEAVRVVLEETHSLLPALRDMVQQWPMLQTMLQDWSQRQQLLQVSPAYQPYNGYYSCRLNTRLIQDIKAYATAHRLSQSELVTVALQAYLEQHQ